MSNPNEQTLIENYFPFPSAAQTLLMRFERYFDQIILLFKTWDKEGFEAVPRLPPYEKLTFPFPLTNTAFAKFTSAEETFLGFVNGVPTQINKAAFLAQLDDKIREEAKLAEIGASLKYYSIDGINKILNVQPNKVAGVRFGLQTFAGTEFDEIMQDEDNQEIFANAQMLCWDYAQSVEPYLKAAYTQKLIALGIA